MKPKTTTLALAFMAAMAGTAWAQDPAQAPPADPAVVQAPANGWIPFSRSSERVYLIDMAKIRREGDIIAVPVARTRLNRPDPGDYSYTIDEIELKCTSGESRATITIDYDSDGAEFDRYEDPLPWGAILPNTIDDFAKSIVCEDNQMTGRSWPTIREFIEAGQPAANAS